MVTMQRTGAILDLLALEAIEEDCLCLRGRFPTQQRYSAVIQVVPEAHFALLPQEEQQGALAGFRHLLTRLAVRETVSIHARIRPYDLTAYLDQVRHSAQMAPVMQEYAQEHEAFLHTLAANKALLEHAFFLRFSASPARSARRDRKRTGSASHRFERARADLAHTTEVLLSDLQRCGLRAHRLSSAELVDYYRSCIHLHHAMKTPLSSQNLAAVGRPIASQGVMGEQGAPLHGQDTAARASETDASSNTPEAPAATRPQKWVRLHSKAFRQAHRRAERHHQRGQLAPELISLPELLQPSLIEHQRDYLLVRQDGDEYSRCRAVIGYPAVLTAGWFDQLLSLDEPFVDLIWSIEQADPTAFIRRLSRKLTGFRSTQWMEHTQGKTENPHIQAARDDVERFRDALVRQEERVHGVSLYVCIRAASKQELKERDARVQAVFESLDLLTAELTYEHLHGWRGVLPDAQDHVRRQRFLDTSSVVTGYPFTACNLSTNEPGVLVGMTPTGSLVLIHPGSPELENGHELIFATSGAGKSYYLKLWLLRSLLQGYEAIVVDPEDEYTHLCQYAGGSTVRLSPGAFSLNPFDLPVGVGDRRVFYEKVESLLVLFDLLLADRVAGTLSQKEKGYLNKMVLRAYDACGMSADPTTHTRTPPSMHSFCDHIIADGDLHGLAERIQRHLPSFPTQTTVGLETSLVVFNIRDLPDVLKPVGLYLVTEFVWNRVRQEAVPRPRFLMIDEAWVLMQFPEGGQFLAGISRRARKYHLHLKLVTQNGEDFLASEAGRTIYQNAAMKFLMRQDAATIDLLSSTLKLSEEERRFLLSCEKGEGLFFIRSSHTPLVVVANDLEHRLATTNPRERRAEEEQGQEQRTAT